MILSTSISVSARRSTADGSSTQCVAADDVFHSLLHASLLRRSDGLSVAADPAVGVVGLLASLLAASNGRSAGALGIPGPRFARATRSVLAASDGRSPVCRLPGDPKSTCCHEMRQASWMHMYRTVGSPSSVVLAMAVTVLVCQ